MLEYIIPMLLLSLTQQLIDGKFSQQASCPPPWLFFNSTRFVPDVSYRKAKEVRFVAEVDSISGKRKNCKIKCLKGAWTGPFCKSDHDDSYHPMLHSCYIEDIPQQLILSIDYQPITSPGLFHHETEITARCQEVGMYRMLGQASVRCDDGQWTPATLPTCQPTTILTNFSQGSPPTIVHHVPTGSVQPAGEGRLVVYPSSIVHLDCLFLRTRGTPKWKPSASARRYPAGWAIDPEEREWKYRLSIYYTQVSDSGNFTCQSPDGAENAIYIDVRAVECSSVVEPDSLRQPSTTSSRLGQTVSFSCPAGYQLVGSVSLTCLANGRWSGSLPQCRRVECPLLDIDDPHLLLTSVNLTHGSRAAFVCAPGHRLLGHRVIRCRRDGTWSAPIPSCRAVSCPEPGTPLNGYMVRSGGTAVGDTVEYFCDPNHVMDGEASSFCTAAGTWSNPTPACLPICEFPGTPKDGSTTPVLFSYRVGDHVKFSCRPGHVLVGMIRVTCQGDGSWSGNAPECRSYTED